MMVTITIIPTKWARQHEHRTPLLNASLRMHPIHNCTSQGMKLLPFRCNWTFVKLRK